MPVFVYEARQLNGQHTRGQIEALNEIEARVKLRAGQLIPVRLIEKGTAAVASSFKISSTGSVSAKELQGFTRQFATLISAGIPIIQSLQILEMGATNKNLKTALKDIIAKVEGGIPVSEAMYAHSKIFDRMYINLVAAGEEGGVLDNTLNRLAQYIEKTVKLRNKVKSAMTYPVVVMIISFLIVFFMLSFVIPKFVSFFSKSGMQLPMLTQIVVDLSDFAKNNAIMIIATASFIGFSIFRMTKSDEGKRTIDTFLLKLPILGDLVRLSSLARFGRTLGIMIQSGTGIIAALEICMKVVNNTVFEQLLYDTRNAVTEGKPMASVLSASPDVPEMFTQMVSIGEATGALDEMMSKVADFYEEEVDYAVQSFTSMLEPLMIVVLGGIVGTLILAVYLPIFNMAQGFK